MMWTRVGEPPKVVWPSSSPGSPVLDPVTVRDVLGHADLKTAEHYLHAVRASRLSDAATRAFTIEPSPDRSPTPGEALLAAVGQLGDERGTPPPPRAHGVSRALVPRISAFYGIAIYMYWNEGHHARPHFHARYGGRAASIDFDGNPTAGRVPARALTLVSERALLHRDELEANVASARDGGPLEPIDPLA